VSNTTVCPKCQSNARRVGSTLASPPSPIYGCTLCGHEWREVDALLPKTPAEKALERDEERREERFKLEQAEHKLHTEVLQKQLAQMDADAAYRKALLDGHLRQTAALEGILALLTQAYNDYERDCGCPLAVMD
jgi:hypothetical protein